MLLNQSSTKFSSNSIALLFERFLKFIILNNFDSLSNQDISKVQKTKNIRHFSIKSSARLFVKEEYLKRIINKTLKHTLAFICSKESKTILFSTNLSYFFNILYRT